MKYGSLLNIGRLKLQVGCTWHQCTPRLVWMPRRYLIPKLGSGLKIFFLQHANSTQHSSSSCWLSHQKVSKLDHLLNLRETTTPPMKIDPWKRRFLLETTIFRFHVSFRECRILWLKKTNSTFIIRFLQRWNKNSPLFHLFSNLTRKEHQHWSTKPGWVKQVAISSVKKPWFDSCDGSHRIHETGRFTYTSRRLLDM